MIVQVQVTIHAPKAAIWAAITDIEHAADLISGIQKIAVVERPTSGLVGLRWQKTRDFFGKPATVEKCITEAVEGESYSTRAEQDGTVYLCTKRLQEGPDGIIFSESHVTQPRGAFSKIMLKLMGFLFKGMARKALMQDLNDIKSAVEQKQAIAA